MSDLPPPKPPYKILVVETYFGKKGGHSSDLRVRVIDGQPFPAGLDVSCSKSMRQLHSPGTRFRVHGKLTQREGGKYFIFSPNQGPYEVVK